MVDELVEDKEEEKEEDNLEEEEELTPTAEKETPIPLTEEESEGRELIEVVDGNLEEEQEEKESGLKLAEDENQHKETEDKEEKEDKKEEEEEDVEQEKEDKETEKDSSESEDLQSENNTEFVLVEEESKQKDGEEEAEVEDEGKEEQEEEDDEDENTTADLLTDASYPTTRSNSNKNLVKTNGHVLLPPDGLRPNPGTPQGPTPSSEPLLCPLVESEPSYTDRDNSLSSAYETYNGDLTNGSSDCHRLNMPFFPDLPLDPEPGSPAYDPGSALGPGFGMAEADPIPSSPAGDRSRTVSSSSTGETPKGTESVKLS